MGLNLKDLNTIVTMKIEPKEYEYLILNLDLELEMAASSLSFECPQFMFSEVVILCLSMV